LHERTVCGTRAARNHTDLKGQSVWYREHARGTGQRTLIIF
jgi:hypothetical protein